VYLQLTQTWFTTHIPGHDYFCEVHEDFIEDDFNLTGGRSGRARS
jgi:casein kinase II subunit beta